MDRVFIYSTVLILHSFPKSYRMNNMLRRQQLSDDRKPVNTRVGDTEAAQPRSSSVTYTVTGRKVECVIGYTYAPMKFARCMMFHCAKHSRPSPTSVSRLDLITAKYSPHSALQTERSLSLNRIGLATIAGLQASSEATRPASARSSCRPTPASQYTLGYMYGSSIDA